MGTQPLVFGLSSKSRGQQSCRYFRRLRTQGPSLQQGGSERCAFRSAGSECQGEFDAVQQCAPRAGRKMTARCEVLAVCRVAVQCDCGVRASHQRSAVENVTLKKK